MTIENAKLAAEELLVIADDLDDAIDVIRVLLSNAYQKEREIIGHLQDGTVTGWNVGSGLVHQFGRQEIASYAASRAVLPESRPNTELVGETVLERANAAWAVVGPLDQPDSI